MFGCAHVFRYGRHFCVVFWCVCVCMEEERIASNYVCLCVCVLVSISVRFWSACKYVCVRYFFYYYYYFSASNNNIHHHPLPKESARKDSDPFSLQYVIVFLMSCVCVKLLFFPCTLSSSYCHCFCLQIIF